MGEYRVGHLMRPDREWEVWDDRFPRDDEGAHFNPLYERWVAFHPALEFEIQNTDHASLEDALAYIRLMEKLYAKELAEHRTLKVGDRVVPRRNMRGFAYKSHVGRDDLVVLYAHPDDPKLVGVGPIGNDPNLPHSSSRGWLAYLAEDLIRVDG